MVKNCIFLLLLDFCFVPVCVENYVKLKLGPDFQRVISLPPEFNPSPFHDALTLTERMTLLSSYLALL